jgi:hypothetical protein
MAALIPYTLLAQGIYSGLIGTISAVTMGTVAVVQSVYTHKNPDADRVLKKLDIERRLKLFDAILGKINKSTQKTLALDDISKAEISSIINVNAKLTTDPVELCLEFLHETITNITILLGNLERKIFNHEQKWFNKWRVLDISAYLSELEDQSKILSERFDDLTKIAMYFAKY